MFLFKWWGTTWHLDAYKVFEAKAYLTGKYLLQSKRASLFVSPKFKVPETLNNIKNNTRTTKYNVN